MRLYSAPLPGSLAGCGDPQQLPPHLPGTFPLFIPWSSWGHFSWVVGQGNSPNLLKKSLFHKRWNLIWLSPLGQDNEVLLDSKQQIYTKYSRYIWGTAKWEMLMQFQIHSWVWVWTMRASAAAWTGLMHSYMSDVLLPSAGSCRTKRREKCMPGSAWCDCQLGHSHSWKRSKTLSCQRKEIGKKMVHKGRKSEKMVHKGRK